nr:MAG TPA: hypothetical protein [Caudoviricetes sp.]
MQPCTAARRWGRIRCVPICPVRRCSSQPLLLNRCGSDHAACKTGRFLKHSLVILLSGLENH